MNSQYRLTIDLGKDIVDHRSLQEQVLHLQGRLANQERGVHKAGQ